MLQVQVQHAANVEQARHNREQERQGRTSVAESIRHNQQTEAIGFGNLSELGRHNRQTEATNWFNAGETARHNVAVEGFSALDSASRAKEAETRSAAQRSTDRHYRQQEEIDKRKNTIEQGKLSETSKHNRAMESIGAENAAAATSQAGTAEKRAKTEASTNAAALFSQIPKLITGDVGSLARIVGPILSKGVF